MGNSNNFFIIMVIDEINLGDAKKGEKLLYVCYEQL